MAQAKPQLREFYYKGDVLRSFVKKGLEEGWIKISASEALGKFGMEALYYAAENETSDYPPSPDSYIRYAPGGSKKKD